MLLIGISVCYNLCVNCIVNLTIEYSEYFSGLLIDPQGRKFLEVKWFGFSPAHMEYVIALSSSFSHYSIFFLHSYVFYDHVKEKCATELKAFMDWCHDKVGIERDRDLVPWARNTNGSNPSYILADHACISMSLSLCCYAVSSLYRVSTRSLLCHQ